MTEQDRLNLIYVPCGSEVAAAELARTLLSEGLIACANIYASLSIYRWKGEAVEEREHVLLCKTTPARAWAARKRIEQLHTYEVPCILTFEADANHAFASWANGILSRADAAGAEAR